MLLSHSEVWKVCVDYIFRPYTMVVGTVTAVVYYLWGCEGQVSHFMEAKALMSTCF
uniref:Uncharacterized protein n=1 Tax=Anguilla anguilla TaxID=7936 RepID=A0A0E9WQU9_ANGAN